MNRRTLFDAPDEPEPDDSLPADDSDQESEESYLDDIHHRRHRRKGIFLKKLPGDPR